MDLISAATLIALSLLYAWIIYNIPILAMGAKRLTKRRRKRKDVALLRKRNLPTVSILVPVKNEETVLDRLLSALLNLIYPADNREIIIVEDGSVDKTVEICRKYAEQYPDQITILRRLVSDGKPSALNYGLKYARGDIVAVFDADSVPEPDCLIEAVRYFEDSTIAAVQGRQCSVNADENMLTKFVSYEEGVRYESYLKGKDALNLFVPITGSCYFVRRSVLEEIGGWDDEALSEDMELSARLTERGYNVRYASDVRSWQENPANLTQFFRQRTRWFRGCMEVALKYGRLLKNLNRKSIDAEITLAGPYMLAPCFMGYLMSLYTFLVPVEPIPLFTIITQVTALFTTATLLTVGITLIYVTKPRKMTNLLWLPFIYAYWSLQTFIASYALIQIILKRPRRWKKTIKTGSIANALKPQ